ncbi:TPA: DNA polymerase III subunit gamma/tau [Candidatus Galligastranaerophilus faecipullorum]|nr:DNA polymerase III subunit gamma/tau [Candidatus Galligastranaerophilus faecipullorum]
MSENYLPLFRKYRPQSFKDLVGQENLVKALTNAIELKRIAHAYLFCGPRGTGKTSSARIFAKSLNCVQGPTVEPCQKCASCVDITNAAGMDVIEIDAATNRGVEGAEDLIAQVHYAPVSGKYKIFIIDEVHMLTATAFNALLKTFEEPPENVIFILATTEPHKVLETIVSRCQRFDFRRITVEDITKRLREISDIENIKITDEALYTIAKNVSGGLRDSLALLDQVSILGAKEEITKETIEELLGKITFDRLLNLLDLILKGDIESTLALVDDIYLKGSEPRNLCENFMEFLRNAIIILSAKNPHDITKFCPLSVQEIDSLKVKNYSKSSCERILDIAIEYYKEIKFATNPYLWTELMLIRASRQDDTVQSLNPVIQPVSAVPKTIEPKKPEIVPEEKTPAEIPKKQAPQETTASKETQTPQTTESKHTEEQKENIEHKPEPAQETPPAKSGAAEGQNPVEIWSKIVNSIESVPAKFFYSGMAKLVEIDDNRIVLGFINHNVIAQAKSELKHKALMEGEKKAFAGTYGFEFVQLGGNIKPLEGAVVKPVVKNEKPQEKKPVEAQAQSVSDETRYENQTEEHSDNSIENAIYSPKVKEMLEAFNGRIVD